MPTIIRELRGLFDAPLAIEEHALQSLLGQLAAGGLTFSAADAGISRRQERRPQVTTNNTWVLPLFGYITQRSSWLVDWLGGTSTQMVSSWLREAIAERAKAIIIEVDSPGGSVRGIEELALQIYEARDRVRIVAVANTSAASGGYWIASQASELIVSPSSESGSIGIVAVHSETSQLDQRVGIKTTVLRSAPKKALGSDVEPLTDEASTEIRRQMAHYHDMFVGAVARGRGASRTTVNAEFGQGSVFGAREAVHRGMADNIGTLEETIARLDSSTTGGRSAGARLSASADADTLLRAEIALLTPTKGELRRTLAEMDHIERMLATHDRQQMSADLEHVERELSAHDRRRMHDLMVRYPSNK